MPAGRWRLAAARIGAMLVGWPAIWLGALAVEILAGGVVVWIAGRHGPALLAVVINLAVCARFAVTLRPGSVPLITRYARCDEAGLPRECEGYTRALTGAWAWVLLLFTLAHAGAFLDVWTTRAVSVVEGCVLLALFLGEHALRGRLFPQLGRVTPLRTLRAMRVSFGARHA
jgi:uncharacterized membrane protein